MSDLIRIVDLEVQAHIGVPDEERREAQRLLVTVEMGIDTFTHAARTDNLARTISYYDVAQRIKAFVPDHPYKLLEALAEELAFDLLKTYPIKILKLEIKKFVLPDARWVAVEITRHHGQEHLR